MKDASWFVVASVSRFVKSVVYPPSVVGASWFLTLMFANVPRVMMRSLPRREPNELNIETGTLFSLRYFPAGPSVLIAPAGLMWSVVIESASLSRQRALVIGWMGDGSGERSTKNGGS